MTTIAHEALALDDHVPADIRLLRRFNWLIRAVLRSPLHRLLSDDLLVLTCNGRRSGRRMRLPLSYVARDGHLYLCTRNSRWWRNLRGDAVVELRLRGRLVAARATVLDASSDEALAGLRLFVTHNPRTGERLYAVRRGDDGPREGDLVREVRRSTVVRLDPLP